MKFEDKNQLLLVNNVSKLTTNICFVNSSIQLMKNTGFVQFILSNRNILQDDMRVCKALVELMLKGSGVQQSAEDIRVLVANESKKEYFNNQIQQDAEEFMRSLIDVICLELKDVIEFDSVRNLHLGEERISKIFLDNLPMGSCIRCNEIPNCRDEEFLFLKLIVPRMPQIVSLSELIQSHYSVNRDVLWMKCSNCCHHEKCPQTGFCNRKAASKTEMLILPEYLFISLLRFGDSSLESKVDTVVEFNERVELPEGNVYTPISTICHLGSTLNSGHYVNYSKKLSGHWWLQNDNKASRASFSQVMKSSSYIILLKKEDTNTIEDNETDEESNTTADSFQKETSLQTTGNNLEADLAEQVCQLIISEPSESESSVDSEEDEYDINLNGLIYLPDVKQCGGLNEEAEEIFREYTGYNLGDMAADLDRVLTLFDKKWNLGPHCSKLVVQKRSASHGQDPVKNQLPSLSITYAIDEDFVYEDDHTSDTDWDETENIASVQTESDKASTPESMATAKIKQQKAVIVNLPAPDVFTDSENITTDTQQAESYESSSPESMRNDKSAEQEAVIANLPAPDVYTDSENNIIDTQQAECNEVSSPESMFNDKSVEQEAVIANLRAPDYYIEHHASNSNWRETNNIETAQEETDQSSSPDYFQTDKSKDQETVPSYSPVKSIPYPILKVGKKNKTVTEKCVLFAEKANIRYFADETHLTEIRHTADSEIEADIPEEEEIVDICDSASKIAFPTVLFKNIVESSFGNDPHPITNILLDYGIKPATHLNRRKPQLIELFDKCKEEILLNLVIQENHKLQVNALLQRANDFVLVKMLERFSEKPNIVNDKRQKLYRCFQICQNKIEFLDIFKKLITEQDDDPFDAMNVIPCKDCGKTFRRKWILKRHKESCKGETQQFICELCLKVFNAKRNLSYHKKNGCTKYNFKCDQCNKSFKKEEMMRLHVEKYHSKIQCEVCNDQVLRRNIARHIQRKHKCLQENKNVNHTEVSHRGTSESECGESDQVIKIDREAINVLVEFLSALDTIVSLSAKKSLSLDHVQVQFEKYTRRSFDSTKLRALMSLMPSAYQISCTTNETQIRFIGKNDLSSMKERKELLISKLESNLKAGETLIQLTELPHIREKIHKSAKDTIKDNVVSDGSSSSSDTDVEKDNVFTKIMKKVKKAARKREKREAKVCEKLQVWEDERRDILKRMIRKLYKQEDRKSIEKTRVIEHLKTSGYTRDKIDNDISYLVNKHFVEECGSFLIFKP